MTADGCAPGLYERRIDVIAGAPLRDAEPCPVCDHARVRALYRVADVSSPIVVCASCGLGRYEPMPSASEIARFYPSDYYAEDGERGTKFHPFIESLVRLVGARHAAFLARGVPPGGRVLDVGCGRGVLLKPLADLGFEVHGVEASEAAVAGADARAQIEIAPDLRDAAYPDAFFDQIIIWHVLEHVPDPRATLVECARILRPGGRLVIAVPNLSSAQARWSGPAWFHLDPPRHLYHFSLGSLELLADRCGFDRESVHHFSLRQNPFGWIQSALNRSARGVPNELYTFLQRRKSAGNLAFSTRLKLWTSLVLGALPAIVLSVVAALMRTGATVHIVARRRGEADE